MKPTLDEVYEELGYKTELAAPFTLEEVRFAAAQVELQRSKYVSKAAEALGISRGGLYQILHRGGRASA